MAFTVEDGTIVVDANAYMTEAEYRAHHADRGVDVTGQVQVTVETAIVNATDYVDKRFGRRWRGERRQNRQELEWPRRDAWTDEGYLLVDIPKQLKKAIAEYTLLVIQLGRNLAPVPAPDFGIQDPATGDVENLSGGKIIEKAEEVGPIKERTKYDSASASNKPMVGTGNLTQQIPEYPQADLWIEELIEPYSNRRLYRG